MEKSRWIPCSQKRPAHRQAVIGCDKTGYVTRYEYDAEDPPCWVDDHEEFFQEDEVVAWMPIPEPYMEGKENACE